MLYYLKPGSSSFRVLLNKTFMNGTNLGVLRSRTGHAVPLKGYKSLFNKLYNQTLA
jgi:hypothetical protein